MSLSFISLLLGGFIFIPVPSEAIVYYVTPTEPPNSDCPGEPCLTLDYYFSYRDRYFNSEKINVTMILLHGKHNLSNNGRACGEDDNPYNVLDLETFEMIGIEPACDVVLQFSTSICLKNVITSYIGTLTFTKGGSYAGASFDISDDLYLSTSSTQSSTSMMDKIKFITVNGTIFNGVDLSCSSIDIVSFNIVVVNSTFTNQSSLQFNSIVHQDRVYNMRHWKMVDCTLEKSNFYLVCNYANITIDDSTFMDMTGYYDDSISESGYTPVIFIVAHSNIDMTGNVLFSNMTNDQDVVMFQVVLCNVSITGDITFSNNKQTAITAYSSNITLSGNVSFLNNTGTNGGAMALYSSTLNFAGNTSVYFYNNTATNTGGAIYVTRDKLSDSECSLRLIGYQDVECFYQLLDYNEDTSWYDIQFKDNSAMNGGDHIYGEYMNSNTCSATAPAIGLDFYPLSSYYVQKFFFYDPDNDTSLSPVSSDPTRVCLCDNDGQPQCAVFDKVYVSSIKVYPGETFTLSAVVVGGDLGTTVGSVHAILANPRSRVLLNPPSQYVQWTNSTICSHLSYTIFSRNEHEVMYLTVMDESVKKIENDFYDENCDDTLNSIMYYISLYRDNGFTTNVLLYVPLLLNVTLLPCPPGFTLLRDPPGCDCYPVLTNNTIQCRLINKSGYHIWSGPIWLNIESDVTKVSSTVIYLVQYCPFDYCNVSKKTVNFQDDADAQCLFNHAGRLCGGCNYKENYSLAIGSSHCIYCPNNNNLALTPHFLCSCGNPTGVLH